MNFHVFIQAHSDLNYIFECGFCKSQLVHPTPPALILSSSVSKTSKQMACTRNVQTNNLPVTPICGTVSLEIHVCASEYNPGSDLPAQFNRRKHFILLQRHNF